MKKKEDRGHAKPVLAARISALVSELDKVKTADIERNKSVQQQDDNIQWRENRTYDRPGDNQGQGSLDSDANRYFKMFLRKYKPDLFVIMEPRISGVTADDFVRTRSGWISLANYCPARRDSNQNRIRRVHLLNFLTKICSLS
ncbi:hypothetical protein V6N13_103628 [Hibiscus sabdariffa]